MKGTMVIILAGGQGERLSILSEKRAKPAVPFAGKYRIIDFALSNCVNSELYNVLVLTQYRPLSLHDHIGNGRPWDLDRLHGGVRLISPYLGRRDSDWYRGTADAVTQNLRLLADTACDRVLILGGDHIYKMDYRAMLEFHRACGAVCTVGVIPVPLDEASRFGIMNTESDGRILAFEEKPAQPRSNLASMGIYVFEKDALIETLSADARDRTSKHDFGHSIIPALVERQEALYAYRFEGYWRDVGTVHSYWQANMELLEPEPELDLYEREWVIHTRSEERPPARLGATAQTATSLISHGCQIDGEVYHSVLSPGVRVEKGAVVRDSIILFDTVVGAGSTVDSTIIDKEAVIGPGCTIGAGNDLTANRFHPEKLNTGLTLIGKRATVPAGTRIGRNCLIEGDVTEADYPSRDIASGESVRATTGALRPLAGAVR